MYQLKIVIFHSYVKLPEGIRRCLMALVPEKLGKTMKLAETRGNHWKTSRFQIQRCGRENTHWYIENISFLMENGEGK